MEREKQIKSGKLLELGFYPVFADGRRIPERAPKEKLSTAAQEKYNHEQAIRRAVRLVNTNYDNTDILMHITYKQEDAPANRDEAKKDFINFIDRIKRKRHAEAKRIEKNIADCYVEELKKRLIKLRQPLKYYCILEEIVYKTGARRGLTNYHYHFFLTGGLDADTIRFLWCSKKARIKADRFLPEMFGPEAAAAYIQKGDSTNKTVMRSRNFKNPEEKAIDGKLTAGDVAKMATIRVDDKKFLEKRYKGYEFIRSYARFNEYNAHWYLTVVMYKRM